MIRLVMLIGLACGLAVNAANAARWFDALPADDPDMVVRRSAPGQQVPAPEPPPGPPGNLAYTAGAAVYNATAGVVGAVAGGIGAVVSGTREALWETAYMFGVNRTKVPRAEVT